MGNTNPSVTQCPKDEDEDDTLSLSDLPLYCDQDIEFWVEDPSLISHDHTEQDFEFSSEMMITRQDSSNPIVFCGKIIPVSPQEIEGKKQKVRCIRRGTNVGRKVKVSVLKPATKSRWFLFMIGFGSSRFPAKEMHIGDLRKRRTSGRLRKVNGYSSSEEGDDGRRRSRGFLRFLRCASGSVGGKDDADVTPSNHMC